MPVTEKRSRLESPKLARPDQAALVGVLGWPARVGLAIALVGVGVFAALSVFPVQAKSADVAATSFSAARAMDDLKVIAASPHPIGSSAQHQVRDYLVGQARQLGLPTDVQTDPVSGAQNVVVRLPGSEGTANDVLITAHYDSAAGSPGAADDGISVAALVETMRVLAAQPRLNNNVVLLFTDGEEYGQTGISAFVVDNPAARRVKVAFAFEASPDSAGTQLRTTTPGDAWLVSELADASLPIYANSALNSSDRDRVGNDFAAFAPAGIPAAEFLTEGHVVRYHNAGDNVAAVNADVVQNQGDTMVALARHFGNLDLTQARTANHDLLFFTAPVIGLVTYPIWVARAAAGFAALVFLAIVVLARRRRRLRLKAVAVSATGMLAAAAAASALSVGIWKALLALHPGSAHTLHYPDFTGSTTAMALILTTMGLGFIVACHWLSPRLSRLEFAAGAVVWWALVAILFSFGEPLFSPIGLWPLIGGVTTLIGGVLLANQPWPRAVVFLVAAVPGLVVSIPLLVLETINVEQGPLVAVPIMLLFLGTLLPQILAITGARTSPRNRPPQLSELAEGDQSSAGGQGETPRPAPPASTVPAGR